MEMGDLNEMVRARQHWGVKFGCGNSNDNGDRMNDTVSTQRYPQADLDFTR